MLTIALAIRQVGKIIDTQTMISALEGLRISLPKAPKSYVSYIDPDTRQMLQAQAVGKPVPKTHYPPAPFLLDNWRIYDAVSLKPSPALVKKRRGESRN